MQILDITKRKDNPHYAKKYKSPATMNFINKPKNRIQYPLTQKKGKSKL